MFQVDSSLRIIKWIKEQNWAVIDLNLLPHAKAVTAVRQTLKQEFVDVTSRPQLDRRAVAERENDMVLPCLGPHNQVRDNNTVETGPSS